MVLIMVFSNNLLLTGKTYLLNYYRMKLEVVTPDKKIFDGEITSVKVPGSKGSFMVLRNHAPLISTLEPGEIEVASTNEGTKKIAITGGVIEVQQNNIIILAENL